MPELGISHDEAEARKDRDHGDESHATQVGGVIAGKRPLQRGGLGWRGLDGGWEGPSERPQDRNASADGGARSASAGDREKMKDEG